MNKKQLVQELDKYDDDMEVIVLNIFLFVENKVTEPVFTKFRTDIVRSIDSGVTKSIKIMGG